ncbi:hypothetical protein DWG17_15455 [Salmonella enterica subsp. enterica serovar Senftenberg]|nr:hypothetical protein DWG17_15455 [Salmonella enterica subsp. enterica serovar Senftenberg]
MGNKYNKSDVVKHASQGAVFLHVKNIKMNVKGVFMKDTKAKQITVRITKTQEDTLQIMVDSGEHKSIAAAVQYLINKEAALKSN